MAYKSMRYLLVCNDLCGHPRIDRPDTDRALMDGGEYSNPGYHSEIEYDVKCREAMFADAGVMLSVVCSPGRTRGVQIFGGIPHQIYTER